MIEELEIIIGTTPSATIAALAEGVKGEAVELLDDLDKAKRLLAVVYDDRTDWRNNAWFKAVEDIGAWPR